MIADIASGHSDAADIVWLIAAVVALLASWNAWPERRMESSLGWLAVALVAVGLLLQ